MIPLLAFAFGTSLVAALAYALTPSRADAIDRRLEELTAPIEEQQAPRFQSVVAALKRLGEKAPRSAKELGDLRLRLVQAGFRRDEALTIFYGIRVAFALLLFAIADMLDLLVVSVEAGLGLDQALQRVGQELAFAYPDLSDELRLINLELRAGKPRSEALRNLADRSGVDDLGSLVTMLIQTDKFGTSVAQALRVYSDTLRTKRRQRAEEAAAKTGVKMVFPLVTCIFPAVWVITIGPAAIKFVTVLFPLIEKSK